MRRGARYPRFEAITFMAALIPPLRLRGRSFRLLMPGSKQVYAGVVIAHVTPLLILPRCHASADAVYTPFILCEAGRSASLCLRHARSTPHADILALIRVAHAPRRAATRYELLSCAKATPNESQRWY